VTIIDPSSGTKVLVNKLGESMKDKFNIKKQISGMSLTSGKGSSKEKSSSSKVDTHAI